MGEVGFRRTGHGRHTAILQDFSPSGCRIESADRLAADDRVWIALPHLEPIIGDVLWTDQWIAGVRFGRALHPAVFDMVLSRLEPAAG